MANWNRRIHRDRLLKAMGFMHGKIPLDYSAVHEEVPVYNNTLDTEPFDRLTIVVTMGGISMHSHSAKHRTFVKLVNGRLIPTGRYHQAKIEGMHNAS